MDAAPAKLIESYDELVQVLRNRVCELGIILDTVDAVAGLAPRYASKLLSPAPVKHFGAVSLFPVLAALGLRMRIEPDHEAIERLSKRSDWYLLIRKGSRYRPRHKRHQRISSPGESQTATSTQNES